MAEIIVAAGTNDAKFAVIDVTNPSKPNAAFVSPNFGGGCAVDADGKLAAVGNVNGGQVQVYDLSTSPATLLGEKDTILGGIGAISIDGSRVLVGELTGTRAVLIDFTNPGSPSIVSTVSTNITIIGSVALSGSKGIVSGPLDFSLDIIDYTDPSNPTLNTMNPPLGAALTVDLAGNLAAVGTQNGTQVALIDVNAQTVLGSVNTTLTGIFSISIFGTQVVAGSSNDSLVALIDFSDASNPVVATFTPGIALGSTVFRGSNHVVTGALNGVEVGLFNVAGVNASPLATINGGISSIATIALAEFAGSGPPPPPPGKAKIVATVKSLDFGTVPVCQSLSRTFQLQNTGTGQLDISSISTSAPFTVSPTTGTLPVGSRQLPVTVVFKPTGVGPVTGVSVTIKSNDPVTPTLVIPVSGMGTPTPPQHLSVSLDPIVFGACLPNEWIGKRVIIANTSPCVPLTINFIATDNNIFPIVADPNPTTLPAKTRLVGDIIPPHSNHTYVVAFGPTSVGTFTATLTIDTDDPDPSNRTATIQISGVGVPAKPTSAALILDRSGSMGDSAQGGLKIDALRSAVGLFADLLPVNQGDFVSAVEFNENANAILDYTAVVPNLAAIIKIVALGLQPDGRTSIGSGMQLGFDQLIFNAHTERKVLVVFTDGIENEPPFIDDVEPGVLSAGMEIYAVGLGNELQIDANRLSELAASSNGKFFASDDALILRKNFVQVLADAFRMNMAGDPILIITPGGVIDVPFQVTRCERRLRFTCTWDDADQNLYLELHAPDGTVFTPNSPSSNQLVRFGTGNAYAFYNLAIPPLDDTDVIAPQVIGTWKLRVSAPDLTVDQERFTSALIVDSEINLQASFTFAETAGRSRLFVDMLHNGVPLPGAEVKIKFRAPLLSAQGILAGGLGRERLLSGEGDSSLGSISNSGTTTGGGSGGGGGRIVNIPRHTTELKARLNTDFRYTTVLPRFLRDGLYDILVEATAPACGGTVSRFTQISVAPAQFLNEIFTTWSVASMPGTGFAVSVVVTPRDAAGNLLGVGLTRKITLAPSEGMTLLRVIDRFDGSYEIQLARDRQARGTLILAIGGRTMTIVVPRHPGKCPLKPCPWAVFALGFAVGYLARRAKR